MTAIYRTTIVHTRTAPVHHTFRYRGYSWYIDLDSMPELPWWIRPFARFSADDHFDGSSASLRTRVDEFLARHGIALPGGRVTALLQARVLGYVFNPLSLYWCHDADGALRAVIAEVHNTYGQRHAYLLPNEHATVAKAMYVSPFNDVSGRYQVHAPVPDDVLAVRITLRRDDQPPFVATIRGTRLPAGAAQAARLQLRAPLAPLVGAARIRIQGIALWLRRVPVVPR